MKKIHFLISAAGVLIILLFMSSLFARQQPSKGYILQHEKDIAVRQPGPHEGGGMTTAYPFFSTAPSVKMAFRIRVLYPGSAIGYHLQKEEEIYYILHGNGIMNMNGNSFAVQAGDAVLTRPGNSHGLKPTGKDSLSLIITYQLP